MEVGSTEPVVVALEHEASDDLWQLSTDKIKVKLGKQVTAGQVLATSDPEKAYIVMMRLLPAGLLGLVIASLLAAFMSTIDTHVNLASSFFVNDIYRRFIAPDADPGRSAGS